MQVDGFYCGVARLMHLLDSDSASDDSDATPELSERYRDRRPEDPSPEEITAECRRIRAGWSEREHWRRAGWRKGLPRWRVPVCRHVNPQAEMASDSAS